NVIFCEGMPAKGTSRLKEATWAFNNRTPNAPSRKRWWSVLIVSKGVGEPNDSFVSETKDPPTTNAASAFCAKANVEAHKKAIKIEKRFIEAPLHKNSRFIGWLSNVRCRFPAGGTRFGRQTSPQLPKNYSITIVFSLPPRSRSWGRTALLQPARAPLAA